MILAKVVFCLLIASIGIRTLANTWYVVPYSQDKVECPAKEQEDILKITPSMPVNSALVV